MWRFQLVVILVVTAVVLFAQAFPSDPEKSDIKSALCTVSDGSGFPIHRGLTPQVGAANR